MHNTNFIIQFFFIDKPSSPRGPLRVAAGTDKTADLEWQPPTSDGGSPITGYHIEARPTSRSSWTKVGSVDRDTTKFTVPDLKEGLEYYFRVTALNDEGESKPLESVDTAKPKKKIGELLVFGSGLIQRKLNHHELDRHPV